MTSTFVLTITCVPYGLHDSRCYYPPGEIGPADLAPRWNSLCHGIFCLPDLDRDIPRSILRRRFPPIPGRGRPVQIFRGGNSAVDTGAVLLPSGNVLVLTLSGENYEFDGTKFIRGVTAPGVMLLLPDGQVLINYLDSKIYTSANTSYSPEWAPRIGIFPPLSPGAPVT